MRLGVVVGRFQVSDLHPAHHLLIGKAMQENDQLLVILGVPHTRGTNNDPLDFATRKIMLNHHYPNAIVMGLDDRASDQSWSRNLDRLVGMCSKEGDEITLYCGRDGFKPHYKGMYKANISVMEALPDYSGTALRVDSRRAPKNTPDFRDGVIYGLSTRYATTFMTVDIAVIGNGGVLMGRRPGATSYRFPGGFVGFQDSSLETCAHRELFEELGLEAKTDHAFEYVCSMPIDDWRYKGRPDQRIMTTLFAIKLEDTVGELTPDGTEFEDYTFTGLDGASMEDVTLEHRNLLMALIRHMDGNQKGVSQGPKKTKIAKVSQ